MVLGVSRSPSRTTSCLHLSSVLHVFNLLGTSGLNPSSFSKAVHKSKERASSHHRVSHVLLSSSFMINLFLLQTTGIPLTSISEPSVSTPERGIILDHHSRHLGCCLQALGPYPSPLLDPPVAFPFPQRSKGTEPADRIRQRPRAAAPLLASLADIHLPALFAHSSQPTATSQGELPSSSHCQLPRGG